MNVLPAKLCDTACWKPQHSLSNAQEAIVQSLYWFLRALSDGKLAS